MTIPKQKSRNLIGYAIIAGAIMLSASLLTQTPQTDPEFASADELSVEERMQINLREQKVSELQASLNEQENITLRSQKREDEILQMIDELEAGCEYIESPQKCIQSKPQPNPKPQPTEPKQ